MSRNASLDAHLLRVLILIRSFGQLGGLAKLAKLDFLLLYPTLLQRVATSLGRLVPAELAPTEAETTAVQSRMVRYKYGPWEDRYLSLVGALVGLGLAEFVEGEVPWCLEITEAGVSLVDSLAEDAEWKRVRGRTDFLAAELDLGLETLKSAIHQDLVAPADARFRITI